jgi:hypothetical protein
MEAVFLSGARTTAVMRKVSPGAVAGERCAVEANAVDSVRR